MLLRKATNMFNEVYRSTWYTSCLICMRQHSYGTRHNGTRHMIAEIQDPVSHKTLILATRYSKHGMVQGIMMYTILYGAKHTWYTIGWLIIDISRPFKWEGRIRSKHKLPMKSQIAVFFSFFHITCHFMFAEDWEQMKMNNSERRNFWQ